MYVVQVAVHKSDIDGRGVFASKDIKKGQLIWEFTKGYDLKISSGEYEKMDENRKVTGYLSPSSGLYVFPPVDDPACYTNHSQNNNLLAVFDPKVSEEPYFIANRDIKKGEELTNNYLEFDKLSQTIEPSWT